jgi:hypothetical protein
VQVNPWEICGTNLVLIITKRLFILKDMQLIQSLSITFIIFLEFDKGSTDVKKEGHSKCSRVGGEKA